MTTLAHLLRLVDFFALAFGVMVGAGWLVVMDDILQRGGPLGALLGFTAGALMLLPIGYVYGYLVPAIPDSAAEAAYVARFFPEKTFKETVARAQQLQFTCNAAMVADHSFYATKGIQRYGSDLRRFVGKTRGQYVEVGGKQNEVPRFVDRICEGILSQDRLRYMTGFALNFKP